MPPPTQNTLRLAVGKERNESNARNVKLPFPSSLGKGPGDGVGCAQLPLPLYGMLAIEMARGGRGMGVARRSTIVGATL